MKKRILIILFFILICLKPSVFAVDDSVLESKTNSTLQKRTNYFDLAGVVDSFLALNSPDQKDVSDKKTKIRQDFIDTTLKFNQGNISVAYDDYSKLIDEVENDTALLVLSKVLYKIGFYSLAEKSIDKIVYQNRFYDNISDLKKSYKPTAELTKEDEIYFARLYSDIYFNNSSREVIKELTKKKRAIYKVNDCLDFTLARAYLENKNYDEALNYINKAISINQQNISYQMLKLDILKSAKKYKDAQKLVQKIKKTKIPIDFVDEINIKNAEILAVIANSEDEKKYWATKKSFIEGNFEKTKKDCQSILNFDKDNDKIITLYAKSELALGNIERANSYFVNSFKINKNNPETLVGLGDIKYLHGDYKNAIKSYKKALKKSGFNYETTIKLSCAYREYAKKQKELSKLEQQIDRMPSSAYGAYYDSAISIAQKNDVLKEEFLRRALNTNPFDEKVVGELTELHLKNKNYNLAKNAIFITSFTLEKNYYYYYLCGLYNQALNKKQEAIRFYKASLNSNPNFEIANVKLLNLIPVNKNEEI